jgi:hypothetical protein
MENLRRDGYLVPVIIGYKPDSQAILIDMRFRSDEEKEFRLAGATAILALNGVKRYVALSDAWMLEMPADVGGSTCKPSQHPNRVEVLIVAWRDGHKRGIEIHAYDRDPSGKVSSFRLFHGPPGMDCGGAWLDLIPQTVEG